MAILIDGYNLLHVTDIFGPPGHPRAFQQARESLLAHVAKRLGPRLTAATTVVFDASDAPPGLPKHVTLSGIAVHFAANHASADDLLEQLIEDHDSPRHLTVVSSDHRVQRAARRRGARYIDSDRWYQELLRQSIESNRVDSQRESGSQESGKPSDPLNDRQVQEWVKLFESGTAPTKAGDTLDQRQVNKPRITRRSGRTTPRSGRRP